MTELRLDPLSGRWVVISEARAKRPEAFELRGGRADHDGVRPCPFCPGHEEDTPPALETYGPEGNWLVRVVPNLYPAFEGDDPFVVENRGPVFTGASAGGIHEVLVFSPDHEASWADITERQAALIMEALRDRIEAHSQSPHLRYTQAIVNSGREAGASLSHPHGQLLGMSFVPRELAEEQARFQRFVGGCLLCTTIEAEEAAGSRILTSDDQTIAIAPYWSSVPFEALILPRHHGPHLSSAPHETLAAVGRAIRTTLRQLRGAVGDVAYNIVFHSAPYRLGEPFHWHAHLWPKATTRAGFEMGTGVAINIVAPEAAAAEMTAQEV